MDFAVSANHRVKLKESEKKDKFFNLKRELKKLWNMKVTFMPIVIGALGTVTEGLLKGLEDLEIRGRVETIHYWDWPEKWEVLETWGDLLSLKTPVKDHQLTLMWKTQEWKEEEEEEQ